MSLKIIQIIAICSLKSTIEGDSLNRFVSFAFLRVGGGGEADALDWCGSRQGDGFDVGGGDGEELVAVGDVVGGDALCMTGIDFVEEVRHHSGVCPCLLVAMVVALTEDVAVVCPCLTGEVVVVHSETATADFEELGHAELREVEDVDEPGTESFVEVEDALHGAFVAAEDDGDVAVLLVGKQGHHELEGEATGVVGVVADELVCFVDHEHPTLCGFEHGVYHGFVVAPTGAYEGGTACHDDVPLAEGSCLVEQGCIDLAEGGLACAGRTLEDGMEGDFVGRHVGGNLVHLRVVAGQGGEVLYLTADVVTAEEFVEFGFGIGKEGEHIDAEFVLLAGEVGDGGLRKEGGRGRGGGRGGGGSGRTAARWEGGREGSGGVEEGEEGVVGIVGGKIGESVFGEIGLVVVVEVVIIIVVIIGVEKGIGGVRVEKGAVMVVGVGGVGFFFHFKEDGVDSEVGLFVLIEPFE